MTASVRFFISREFSVHKPQLLVYYQGKKGNLCDKISSQTFFL